MTRRGGGWRTCQLGGEEGFTGDKMNNVGARPSGTLAHQEWPALSNLVLFVVSICAPHSLRIECQGGYVESVQSYDSAANDVWSLGVILINLAFGRNPWKQACPRDETFAAYVQNNDFLQSILPMSNELNEIIKSVFCLNPKKRITLPELASRVHACSSFTIPEPFMYSTPAASDPTRDPRDNGDKEDSGVDLRS